MLLLCLCIQIGCSETKTTPQCTDATQCRRDEACHASACIPWSDAPLIADFEILQEPAGSSLIVARVLQEGFPRDRVEHLRFSLGDGFTGWGESVTHRYEEPGIYPIDLEVTLEGYRVLRASRLVTIEPSQNAQTHAALTLNAIPDYLNGSVPYLSNNQTPNDASDDYEEQFHLLTPRHGLNIDITLFESAQDPVNRETLTLTANVPLGNFAAGDNLIDQVSFDTSPRARVPRARWRVAEDHAFPVGMASLNLYGETQSGAVIEDSLSFEVTEMTSREDPWDRPM